MVPPYLDVQRWKREVEIVFSKPTFEDQKEEWLSYLDDYFLIRPRTLVDRWRDEMENK